tara:strand:- start:61 stop:894 length:834 start_codon:yes stop_codon:yes gene_type:complete
MKKKTPLMVSVSGGRTSAYMAYMLKANASHLYDLTYVFANTGAEHQDTLRFLNEVDTQFSLGIVWLEAVVHHNKRIGSTHKQVTYQTASRNSEPFTQVVKKYGVPNKSYLHCTRELKLNPIRSYMREIGGADITHAIGIREDENRRVSKNATKDNLVYPLVDWFPTDKQDVLDFFAQYDWDLAIPEYLGNCVTCHKKSFKKLMQVHKEMPDVFSWTGEMEREYGHVKAPDKDRVFFREHRSTEDMIKLFAATNADPKNFINDKDAGCSESCELFETT